MRGTSYIYPSTPLTDAQAARTRPTGFEVGLHVNTDCADFTAGVARRALYDQQLPEFAAQFPSVPAPLRTQRAPLHRLERLGTRRPGAADQRHPPRHQLLLLAAELGCTTRPGMFTGSGMPMRFAEPRTAR